MSRRRRIQLRQRCSVHPPRGMTPPLLPWLRRSSIRRPIGFKNWHGEKFDTLLTDDNKQNTYNICWSFLSCDLHSNRLLFNCIWQHLQHLLIVLELSTYTRISRCLNHILTTFTTFVDRSWVVVLHSNKLLFNYTLTTLTTFVDLFLSCCFTLEQVVV